MKMALAMCFLISLASTAMSCELTGIKGTISNDGQTITGRQVIPLKEQARTYGGFQKAADVLEQNRLTVLQNHQISDAVRQQVDNDMQKNVADLKCWAALCAKDSTNPACHF